MTGRQYRLGVFDRPILKDWAFWNAVAWSLLMFASTVNEPIENSSSPHWVDVLGVTFVTFLMVGWPIAALRRIFREIRGRIGRRGETAEPQSSSTPSAISVEPLPPATWMPGSSALPPTPPPPLDLPIPIRGFTGGEFRDSETLSRSRQEHPYPVARAVRALQTTQDPLEQYQNLLDLGEALTVTLGMLSASWLRQHAPQDASLRMLYDNYLLRGVSQGHWHAVTRAAEKAMVGSQAAIPGFIDGVRSRKANGGGLDALGAILGERNRAAHGAHPHNRSEAAVRIAEMGPTTILAVERANFLGDTFWVLVESVALRRHDKRWNARLRKVMGDHPDFDVMTQILAYPLANDTFYVLAEPEALDLTPMMVMRYCDQCRQPEVCYADRVDEHSRVSLKSFARGHQVFDTDLIREVRSLLSSDPSEDVERA